MRMATRSEPAVTTGDAIGSFQQQGEGAGPESVGQGFEGRGNSVTNVFACSIEPTCTIRDWQRVVV